MRALNEGRQRAQAAGTHDGRQYDALRIRGSSVGRRTELPPRRQLSAAAAVERVSSVSALAAAGVGDRERALEEVRNSSARARSGFRCYEVYVADRV